MSKLFFSYSHKDEDLRNELETHLSLLRRQGVISSWHDRRILAGSDFEKSISTELESAQIILLLVSANFLASDYCYDKEMMHALKKHEEGSAVVIPVILHPCDWHSAPFGTLRATPNDGKAVSMFANPHEAYAIIAKDVRETASSILPSKSQHATVTSQDEDSTHTSQKIRSSNLRLKRKFDDHEKDEFLENTYEYIARYFEGSLEELEQRNSHIKARFKRTTETSFSAYIYDNGNRVAECSIYYGDSVLGSHGISFSNSAEVQRNSFNETISVVDDGYTLRLKALGFQYSRTSSCDELSQQGAAEYYWSMLVDRLQ